MSIKAKLVFTALLIAIGMIILMATIGVTTNRIKVNGITQAAGGFLHDK
jgi:hypothetical protein